MNFHFFQGACSLAINIALREAGMLFNLIEVDYATRRLADGTDFRTITSKGYVPALLLDDATCLTEVIEIFDYIDFRAPDVGLLGKRGTAQRQAALEWLCFVATEIHKSFSPVFRPDTPATFLKPGLHHLERRLSMVEEQLSRHAYVAGHNPTAVDFYLVALGRWMEDVGLCPDDWTSISEHAARLGSRKTVQSALNSENLCLGSICRAENQLKRISEPSVHDMLSRTVD